jgi:hypothetical protein
MGFIAVVFVGPLLLLLFDVNNFRLDFLLQDQAHPLWVLALLDG